MFQIKINPPDTIGRGLEVKIYFYIYYNIILVIIKSINRPLVTRNKLYHF